MPDMPNSQADDRPQPIFTADMLCLHCAYNLRGLTEPICPECGHAFNPQALVAFYREKARQGPPAWRLLWLAMRHPVKFWRLPALRMITDPAAAHAIPMSAGLGVVAICLCAAAVMGLPAILLSGGAAGDLLGIAGTLFLAGALGTFILVMGVLSPLVVLHGGLCWLVARWFYRDAEFDLLDRYLGYASAWGVPAVVLLAMAAMVTVGTTFQPVDMLVATILMLGCAACSACWAVALFFGARQVLPGRSGYALWCVATNPFWYVVGLVLLVGFLL